MRDGVETGKKTGRRKISRQKNFTAEKFHGTTDRELTVLPAKLIKTNDVYVSFPVQCRRGSVQIRSFIVVELYFSGII